MSELQLHTLKPASGSRKTRKRLGRGEGSGLGKTSGRGTKGQRARSGGKSGLKAKGLRRIILRIPKNRGFKSGILHPVTVTLAQLDHWFDQNAEVTVKALKKQKRIPGDAIGAKIVKTGELKKALKIEGIFATSGAIEAIKSAGGSIIPPTEKKKRRRKKK